jgi:hypothetical protein
MSEHYGATIFIGGELPAKALPSFIKVINKDIPWFNEDISPEDFLDTLSDYMNVEDCSPIISMDNSLRFSIDSASDGKCFYLEEFCRKNNLNYIRYSDAYLEASAEVSFFLAGMREPTDILCTPDFKTFIPNDSIKNFIKEIEEFKLEDAPLNTDRFLCNWALKNKWDPIEALKAWIDHASPEIPKSPGAFKII